MARANKTRLCILKKEIMNKEFKELFKQSGLTKAQFSRVIGMKRSNLHSYLTDKIEMKIKTFQKYSCKLK